MYRGTSFIRTPPPPKTTIWPEADATVGSYGELVSYEQVTPVGGFVAKDGWDHGHPTPCTPNSTLYTIHPTPYTLHPTSYTLHPTPHTLHPAPYTLHPSPFTLYPTPYTLHPTPPTVHTGGFVAMDG